MKNDKKNPIKKRYYYDIDVKLASPLNIGGGESLDPATDSDVLCNNQNEYFIPGSSIAGAFRNYVGEKKNEPSAFGFADSEEGKMSSIFISDLYLDVSAHRIASRDRVHLNEEKQVATTGKFDMQVIEPGATGTMKIEVVERETGESDYHKVIDKLLLAVQNGEVRFGSSKNRGLGRMTIENVACATFDSNTREEWIKFIDNGSIPSGKKSFEEWKEGKTPYEDKYLKFSVPLKLTGGISIRKYSAKPGKADYEHITSSGKPVIPGTSWNGAIRAAAVEILSELGVEDKAVAVLIDEWFGSANQKATDQSKPASHQSKIIIGESVIKGATPVSIKRNKIDRFSGGTSDTALFTDISYFGGETTLEYMISKDLSDEMRNGLSELMDLIVEDIKRGMVAVGGQVAIGRGIFEGIDNDNHNEEKAIGKKNLYNLIRR